MQHVTGTCKNQSDEISGFSGFMDTGKENSKNFEVSALINLS